MRRGFLRDEAGASAVEFAIVGPVFLALMFGGLDLSYNLLNRSVLYGAMDNAARLNTLESGIDDNAAVNAAVVTTVRNYLGSIVEVDDAEALPDDAPPGISFRRRSYTTFSDVAQRESWNDDDEDDRCDNGEAFDDSNGDGVHGDRGRNGTVGSGVITLFSATVSYERQFRLIPNLSPRVVLTKTSVLRTQPYASTNVERTIVSRQCPAEDV